MPAPMHAPPAVGWGRGDVRIGAVVAVEHRCLSAFEEDVLAFFDELLDGVVGVFDVRTEFFCVSEVVIEHGFVVEAFHAVEFFEEQVFLFYVVFQFFSKSFLVHEVADADADTVDLVCVARSDAVLCCADLAAALAGFFGFIETDVVWEYDLCSRGDLKVFCVDALFFKVFHFFEKTLWIDDDACADDADRSRVHDAAWHQAQRICFASRYDCMACVVSSLRTYYDVCLRGEIINDLAFAFIAPLGADYHCCCHVSFFLPVEECPRFPCMRNCGVKKY